MISEMTPAVTPPDPTGWTLTRHRSVLFAYTDAGLFVGAVGPVPAGPNAGSWWAVTTGLAATVVTGLADQSAALDALAGLSGRDRP